MEMFAALSHSTPIPHSEPVEQPCHDDTEYDGDCQLQYATFQQNGHCRVRRKSLVRSIKKGLVKRIKKFTSKLNLGGSHSDTLHQLAQPGPQFIISADVSREGAGYYSGPTSASDRKVFNWLCESSDSRAEDFGRIQRLTHHSVGF
eukprot:TRINITY_DN2148_c1_g1_i10.p3 TRINITY_DN2148_c1_g1~~TRINITY_DN2148_c1_g1_i10.p3  ORF type:complete len:146 (-),score=10.36 TRINITY_DN2148_c1_g1_i10:234-671(-)